MKLLDLDLEHCFFLTPISNSSVHSTAGDARARQGDLSIVHGMEKWKNALNVPRPDSTWDLGFCPSACVCFFFENYSDR